MAGYCAHPSSLNQMVTFPEFSSQSNQMLTKCFLLLLITIDQVGSASESVQVVGDYVASRRGEFRHGGPGLFQLPLSRSVHDGLEVIVKVADFVDVAPLVRHRRPEERHSVPRWIVVRDDEPLAAGGPKVAQGGVPGQRLRCHPLAQLAEEQIVKLLVSAWIVVHSVHSCAPPQKFLEIERDALTSSSSPTHREYRK